MQACILWAAIVLQHVFAHLDDSRETNNRLRDILDNPNPVIGLPFVPAPPPLPSVTVIETFRYFYFGKDLFSDLTEGNMFAETGFSSSFFVTDTGSFDLTKSVSSPEAIQKQKFRLVPLRRSPLSVTPWGTDPQIKFGAILRFKSSSLEEWRKVKEWIDSYAQYCEDIQLIPYKSATGFDPETVIQIGTEIMQVRNHSNTRVSYGHVPHLLNGLDSIGRHMPAHATVTVHQQNAPSVVPL